MPVSVKVGGVWKTATAVYNKVGGAWKTASDMPVKIGGVWKTGILESGAYESIATATGTGSSNTITFSSIPSTYTSLQLRIIARDTQNGGTDPLIFFMRMNNDTTVNYVHHYLDGDGASVTAGWDNTANRIPFGYFAASGYAAGIMGTAIVDIHNYAVTTQNKTIRSFSGVDRNATTGDAITLRSGLWLSTAAINTLTITNNGGANWSTDSTFALYGIKGA